MKLRTTLRPAALLIAALLVGCAGAEQAQTPSAPATAIPTFAGRQPTQPAPSAPQAATSAPQATTSAPQAQAPASSTSQGSSTDDEQTVLSVFERTAPAVALIRTNNGLGSGFLIDASGLIISNAHVVEGGAGTQVRVAFTNLFETVGTVVGVDPDSDIAVVKVDELPRNITPVQLGDSAAVKIGRRTIAIGNPLGQERTVTTGIVSAVGRTIAEDQKTYRIGGAIQTDAAINPGNSGGPLLDWDGRVIGMNTAILSQSGTSSGIGFAVPINLIKKVSAALIKSGKYDHPYLGVGLRDVTTLDAKQNNLPGAGVLLQPSDKSSPVAAAGLTGAAVLTAVNGQPIFSGDDLIAFLELNAAPGDTVTLRLLVSGGQTRDLQVKLGARPGVTK